MTDVHHDEQDVFSVIEASRILPVVVLDDARDADPLAAALARGGLRSIEVTFRTVAAAEAIRVMSERPEVLVGAGTVLTPAQVDQAVEAGARFVVSPGFGPQVVRHCQQLGVPVFPGAVTPTEIQLALDAGLDTVKFFPAEQLGGIGMLTALAAPFRSVRFIPTGGVNTRNLADYLAHPAVLAVGGTWMVAPELIAAARWDEVTARTAAAVAAARPEPEA
ncbi:bifunctional 4-hydroxy-2-oxoglutarate aldolase/2-dehydro-3-deoxy-phosphogluconate aldolase [Micromonospora sp. PLK6-60]|uniref:bifunctional 4-hydroxy-2-oxoglutarate aldolase/2-dehydro-3-deoxy-phosphogluconate aldolase n=1 Tax=Micromonospora sp. PLK6-60 TaxID=2873383 RepID=UPI001CA627BB|nr:bifunctional 4-hydroxy-2-oxoglutarate aldolase/2-dehydro-3-deoxy-phosphogluconate aldolase [Micromonospora sp. PLK6-60]MBY8875021.1 bifunctional 4-hydroxy-2-oxoglutarate aldolase/2-dehydro-3-deoxy-phosphogluconate aldolase [Micromonospora sp. PLK6-60]